MTDEPIYMLNALWFKAAGGAEKYQQYLRAASPITASLGARMLEGYKPEVSLIGEWDPDLFFVVEWPSEAAFKALMGHEGYNEIKHLREEALDKSLLIRCKKIG